ncbi:MAG: hypothetical protein A2X40_07070 [Elusimicrobia bacterium GWC2_65_9]|nr:MAG: hypothetical protein A2X37_06450 [Elusimicrobia bacterium GWA2_66_18]OGR72343.1 MAG: hypothetical protein A2X40_07070 [Elusimicrobia bacterium GWC2_65_9]
MQQPPLRYWFWWPIRTLDTFEADTPPVMQVARNIYAPLVSEFLDGKAQGLVAEDWRVDQTGKNWTFRIRKGLVFDDGDPITPKVVLANFRRILWLTRGEKLALNALLPEIAGWKDFKAPLQSLHADQDSLYFHFDRRPVDLFEAIGQPIYGIANPKCFDHQGLWKDPFCHSASGQYRIIERSPNRVVLRSRNIFPAAVNAPETVEINAPVERDDNVVQALRDGRGDLTVEHSFAISRRSLREIGDSGLKMVAEPPVRMHFMHLNASRRPFKSKALRQSLRDSFLRALKSDARYASSGIEVDPSFIPKGGVGYAHLDVPRPGQVAKASGEPVDVLFFPLAAERETQEAIEDSVVSSLKAHGLVPRVKRYPDRFEPFNRMRRGDFDVIIRGTGILVNNPYADLRMMFMSKIGAMIPDPSGAVAGLIEKAEREQDSSKRSRLVEEINRSVFEEAAIITFAHSNLLYIHNRGVDLSHLNIFADPIEFRAVSWNP